MLTQFDHGGANQAVIAYTAATGPHAIGSFANGHAWLWDRYAIGAWVRSTGPIGRLDDFVLGHVMWNSGIAADALTAPEVTAIQDAFNGVGTVEDRVKGAIAALVAAKPALCRFRS